MLSLRLSGQAAGIRASRPALPSTSLVRRPQHRRLLCRAFEPAENGAAEGASSNATAPVKKAAQPKVDHIALAMDEIAKGEKVVIAQVAPAVRVSIGEEFGLPAGTATTGKLVSALRALGFDYVFDTLAGADMTIMEEGNELMERIYAHLHPGSDLHPGHHHAGPLPMFTSCCPGWIEMMEKSWPELIPHVSSCKSPQLMVGSAVKNYFARKIGRSPHEVSVVSIMPCLKKQGESDRIMHQTEEGARDVDHVITTRELAELCKARGVDYPSLPDAEFNDFMGAGTGAAALFGTTGGVMEAALRNVYDMSSGGQLPRLQYSEVRGLEGVKQASVTIPANPGGPLKNAEPLTLNVAVANGLGNAKKLVKEVQEGRANYHFVEIMACPGGCIGGGGQPRSKDKDVLQQRQAGLYSVDERKALRRSYESPVVKQLYEEWLGEPGSAVAHATLHTYYEPCGAPAFDITAPKPEAAAAPQCPLPSDDQVCVFYSSSSSSASESEAEGAASKSGAAGQKPAAAAH